MGAAASFQQPIECEGSRRTVKSASSLSVRACTTFRSSASTTALLGLLGSELEREVCPGSQAVGELFQTL